MSDSRIDSRSDSRGDFEVVVNGDVKKLVASCSIAELLAALELGGRRVAVAVNRDIVLRSSYSDVQLVDGDRIEILEAVGGG